MGDGLGVEWTVSLRPQVTPIRLILYTRGGNRNWTTPSTDHTRTTKSCPFPEVSTGQNIFKHHLWRPTWFYETRQIRLHHTSHTQKTRRFTTQKIRDRNKIKWVCRQCLTWIIYKAWSDDHTSSCQAGGAWWCCSHLWVARLAGQGGGGDVDGVRCVSLYIFNTPGINMFSGHI